MLYLHIYLHAIIHALCIYGHICLYILLHDMYSHGHSCHALWVTVHASLLYCYHPPPTRTHTPLAPACTCSSAELLPWDYWFVVFFLHILITGILVEQHPAWLFGVAVVDMALSRAGMPSAVRGSLLTIAISRTWLWRPFPILACAAGTGCARA